MPAYNGKPVADNWESLGLHHWSMLALLFGAKPPLGVDENLPGLAVADRLAKVAELLGLSDEQPRREIIGPGETGTVILNGRLVEKMRDEQYAKRTPIIPWISYAVENAIEVWRQTVTPKGGGPTELRTYYLAPLAFAEEHECYMAISGEDGVLFNIMRSDASYANNIRSGSLIYAREVSPCVSICCDRYLELRSDFIQANAEVLELRQRNRKLKDRLARLGQGKKKTAPEG